MKQPLSILLNGPNYQLRTIVVDDNMGNWCEWMANADTALRLNAVPQTLTANDFRRYVEAFDRVNNHLIGIYKRANEKLVGLWAVYVNWDRSAFLVNVIVGDVDERKTGVRQESARMIHDYFFNTLGLQHEHCSVVSTNQTVLSVMADKHWTQTGRESKPSATGSGQIELLHFQRSRDTWNGKVRRPPPLPDGTLPPIVFS